VQPPLFGLVVDQLGFLTGIVLYAMLVVMVWRERSAEGTPLLSGRGRLPLWTGFFGLIWNVGALASLDASIAGSSVRGPEVLALAFTGLGFLPAVVVHSLLEGRETVASSRFIRSAITAAYGLSATAGVLHAVAAFRGLLVPSPTALWVLTVGFAIIAAWLLFLTRQQPAGRRGIWVVALSVFAVSALHFNQHGGNESWWVELVGHHASLPLALAILHQDYRFAFADLFLRNAIALLMLVGTSLGVFAGVVLPVLRWRDPTGMPDPRAIALVIVLWIGTVVAYTNLRRLASRLVDRSVLQRPDYERALERLSERLAAAETEEAVLEQAVTAVRSAIGTPDVQIVNDPVPSDHGRLAITGAEVRSAAKGSTAVALLRVRTVEPPHVALLLGSLQRGRRLLSDDLQWLEAVARLTARQIDSLRVSQERVAHRLREEAMERLATEAELRALRAQLQPHFLFNALTTIGYLIQNSPPRALDTLFRLTAVLRGVLRRTTQEFSTLGEELELIRSYLDIERARFEERLEVTIDVAPDARQYAVPTLLLQPLVENAVKHGIAHRAEGGTVSIRATADDGTVRVTIEDSGAGFTPGVAGHGLGVGLRSVDERLRAHYGSLASLRVESATGSGTRVDIAFPAVLPAASLHSDRRRAG
jgi:two-component system LytT family sensor kinase